MRTVIIATQNHIDWINRYKLFLDAFLDPEVKFCPWVQDKEAIDDMIPQIYECIGGNRDWRAIIIFDDEKTKYRINPFDVVDPIKYEVDDGDTDETDGGTASKAADIADDEKLEDHRKERFAEYVKKLDSRTKNLKKRYEEATGNPLTKLCTYLCQWPIDTKEELAKPDINRGKGEDEGTAILEKSRVEEFNHYKETAKYKRELREKLAGDYSLAANLPKEVLCLSLRTILDKSHRDSNQFDIAWKSHTDVRYSDFGDRNLYFEKMRYFVYDILPENHVNYEYNYLEFICTLLIFSANIVPCDAIKPNRLYSIESDFSENRLRGLIVNYDRKLKNTIDVIARRQKDIEHLIPGPMTDREAENSFHSNIKIPVKIDTDFDMDGFYADENVFGLSKDCPAHEMIVWSRMYRKSDTVMHKLMKQPRRSIERATEEFRKVNKEESPSVLGLNHFQLEDIKEYVDAEEDRMISIKTNDFYDIKRYEEATSEGNKRVEDVIETRMVKKITLILGISALVIFFIGFIPVIFFNKSVLSVPIPALLGLLAIAILAVVALIALFYLRGILVDAVKYYNEIMKAIKNDVNDSMDQFSKLLSSACHVMRGNYVLNECKKNDNSFRQRIRVLGGHIQLIRDRRSEMKMLFGEYLNDSEIPDTDEYFDYNFERVCEYEYPIPIENSGIRKITFVEDGNKISVPFDFIDSIKLRMEELYE